MNSLIDVAVRKLSEQPLSESALRLQLEAEFAALPNLDSRIDAVCEHLKGLQVLNDLRLAKSLAQHYSHKGNRLISHLLQQKGIQSATIRQALAFLEDEPSRALQEARRRVGADWDKSERAIALLYRFLAGRGFSELTIHAVINKLNDSRRYLLRCAA